MDRADLTLLVLVASSALALPALAGDGVLEINQTCAVETGCFEGDTPGFPVTITQPGAYRLTGSLGQISIPGLISPTDAISIEADQVQLDLGGFSISCTSITLPCGGNGSGITSAAGRAGVRVSHGVVRGMPDSGINLILVENAWIGGIQALDNGSHGIYAGRGSIIRGSVAARNGENGISASHSTSVSGCSATDNGGDGIFAGPGSTLVGNSASANHLAGIDARDGSIVSQNAAFDNLDDGIQAINGSSVNGNTVRDNGQYGLDFGQTGRSAYRDNTITDNAAGSVAGNGTDAGGNLCGITLGCP